MHRHNGIARGKYNVDENLEMLLPRGIESWSRGFEIRYPTEAFSSFRPHDGTMSMTEAEHLTIQKAATEQWWV